MRSDKSLTSDIPIPCGTQCDWSLYKDKATASIDPEVKEGSTVQRTVCGPGVDRCYQGDLLMPLASEKRSFFTKELREATKEINAIFKKLRKDAPKGRHLTMLRLPGVGLMLSWSQHGLPVPSNAVTGDMKPHVLKKAFGLTRSSTKRQSGLTPKKKS